MEHVKPYIQKGKAHIDAVGQKYSAQIQNTLKWAKKQGAPDLNGPLQQASQQLGISADSVAVVAVAVAMFVVLVVLWMAGALAGLGMAGSTLWYMYQSVNALEKSSDTVTTFLMYWVVKNGVLVLETSAIGWFLRSLPFYPLMKMVGLMALGVPATGVADKLFERLAGCKPGSRGAAQPEVTTDSADLGPTMHVKLVGAGPLPESCDCFATVQVCPQGGRSKEGVEGIIFKTKTQRATNTPLFNENFVLKPVTSLEAELVVSLVNKKAIGADQTICDVKIPLGKVTPGANADVQDLQLSGKDTGAPAGMLHIELQLKA